MNAIYRIEHGAEYQNWAGYPDSPVSIGDYPYQLIMQYTPLPEKLLYSPQPFYYKSPGGGFSGVTSSVDYKYRELIGGAWSSEGNLFGDVGYAYTSLIENNYAIYTDNTLSTVLQAATVDQVSETVKKRIRAMVRI